LSNSAGIFHVRKRRISGIESEKKRGGHGCLILSLIGLFVPVIYVLSIGPANLITTHFPAAQPVIEVIYWPITVVCSFCEPVNNALVWYADLWR
jgi:hypothetical protein